MQSPEGGKGENPSSPDVTEGRNEGGEPESSAPSAPIAEVGGPVVAAEARAAFELAKGIGAYRAIMTGRQIGIPEAELVAFTHEVIAAKADAGDAAGAWRLMGSLQFGTDEEHEAMARRAYEQNVHQQPGVAREIAEQAWGTESPEFGTADVRWRLAQDEVPEDVGPEDVADDADVTITPDATFDDLFAALEAGDGRVQEIFDHELVDHADRDVVDEVLRIQADRTRAAATSVVAFFKNIGWSKRDLQAYLPIRIQRKRRK
ncbi:hypothetical protein HY480_04420 [Candidatus Uhrbacteria bacterium]|nr:hypothetical protein [Candidatus Uhrbacteria bacterium]